MKLTMRKFDNVAKRNHVKLIDQVTGADGKLLQKASDFATTMGLIHRSYPTRTLNDIKALVLN